MRGVVRAMLEGMPEPSCLHLERAGGRCLMMVGSAVLAEYAEADTVMRNFAVTVARSSGFGGKRVAEVFGLSAAYVATLHAAAQREGSAALVKRAGPGRPRTLDGDVLEKARQLRASGVSDREIGRRLGVAGTTAGRRLGPQVPEPAGTSEPEGEAAGCEALVSEDEASGAAGKDPAPGPGPEAVPVPPAPAPAAVPVPGAGAVPPGGLVPAAGGVVAEGTAWSRYAGAMLLHAFAAHAGAGQVLAAAAGGDRGGTRPLAAVSACFGLGAATTEQFKHLAAAEAGPRAGLGTLPDLRTLRPALAGIAGRADPLELQAMFAQAMLDADPVTSGVYYVDDHFVPYTGAKPVPKGWNNKRGRAEKGRADTHVTAHDGRAGCEDHARLRPGRRLPGGVHPVPRPGRALGDLPAGAAGRPRDAPGHHHGHHRRQDPGYRLGRRESAAQGLRRGPAAHLVRARQGRPADPCLRLRILPGGDPGLAEVPLAGRDLPQVRVRELRDRQDLRLRRHHRDEHQDHRQPGAQGREHPGPRHGKGTGRRRARPRRAARRPGPRPRRQEQGDPRRQSRHQRGEEEPPGRGRRPGQGSGETARRPDRP